MRHPGGSVPEARVGQAGPVGARLLLVGEAPGETEVLRGEPFVGPAGQLLREACAAAGLDWSALRRTNAVSWRPPGNRTPTAEEVASERPRLLAEIEAMPRLQVIVALGNVALEALVGGRRGGITQKRGVPVTWGRYRVLPTLHPAYVLRDRTKFEVLVGDLRRAAALLDVDEAPADTWYTYSLTSAPVHVDGPVAVDTETWQDGRLRLCMWAPCGSHEARLGLPARWAGRYVMHNARFDLAVIESAEGYIPFDRVEDTMLMAHLLDENSGVGLKDLFLRRFPDREPYWLQVEPLLARKRDEIPDDVLAAYCAADTVVTGELYLQLKAELERHPRLEALYRHLSLPLSRVLYGVERRGVPVDEVYGHRLVADLRRRLNEIHEELSHVVPEAGGLNLRSADQVAWLLYERLGLKTNRTTRVKGRASTDERTLRELADLHPAAEVLWRWRKTEKLRAMVQGWLDRAVDGRVYPRYNQTGTATGRLSGRDPNPQNLPTDPDVRRLVRAPDGCVVLSADYAMIELVVAGWLYGEPAIVEAYEDGVDLHAMTAEAVLGRPPADKEERKRYGKTPNFGLLYMQGVTGFREYAWKLGVKMTVEEAAAVRDRWHAAYPRVRSGWQRILQEHERLGYVEAPSGRRRRVPADGLWGPEAVNFVVQCTAAELTHAAAILADQAGVGDLILHVHDALVFVVPAGRVERAAATLQGLMQYDAPAYLRRRLGYSLPFTPRAEVSAGPTWGDLTEV